MISIGSRLRQEKKKKRHVTVPAIEAGENDSMVSSKADSVVEEHNIENQIDPEKLILMHQ